MKLNQQRRANYANEHTEQGLRQWLIIGALLASLVLILFGVRLILH